MKCKDCEGTGMWKFGATEHARYLASVLPCPDCNGTGKVERSGLEILLYCGMALALAVGVIILAHFGVDNQSDPSIDKLLEGTGVTLSSTP